MRLGLTYDLKEEYLAAGYSAEETAEFDRVDVVESIERSLHALGHQTDRIGNARALATRLVAGDRWDLVFNLAEGLRGVAREAQVPALLEAFEVPYVFSDPMTMAVTLDKDAAKTLARAAGVPTPESRVVRSAKDLARVDLAYPLFAKPVAEGSSKGIGARSLARSPKELEAVVLDLLPRFPEGVLVERYLPGREFTVGIVGTGDEARALGVMEIRLGATAEAGGYGYDNKTNWEGRVSYALVHDDEARRAKDVALAAWRALRCRDGGRVDVKSDERGAPQLLEVNPLAGLHPERGDIVVLAKLAGHTHESLLGMILDAARRRLGLA